MTQFETLVVWAAGISTLISLATTIWNMVSRTARSNAKAIEDHDHRLTKLEQDIRQMPAKDDMHNLELALAAIGGDLKAMRATMKGMSESLTRTENIVGRHEDHFRENSR